MVESFGEKLRELRKQKGLTQAQLASLIGVKNSVISFYELSERVPSPEVLIKLSSALHVSTDYLLGVEKSKTISVSGLTDEDIALVRALIDSLRNKNQQQK